MARNGYVKITQTELNKKIGVLYLKKNEINLGTDILDIPDYFWENDNYQRQFTRVHNYFEIEKRTEILNYRLNIIGVIFTKNRNY